MTSIWVIKGSLGRSWLVHSVTKKYSCDVIVRRHINLLYILFYDLHMESCLPCNARFGEGLRMGTGVVKVPIAKPLTKIGDDRTRFPTNHHF